MNLLASLLGSSDEQAMWRVQQHDDEQAFAQLFRRWETPIKRLCLRMLGDDHKADDLTQEAFSRVYGKRKDYQHGGKFSTFLWRVATNLCLDEIRRIKRRREWSVLPRTDDLEADPWAEMPGTTPSPDDTAISNERAAEVRLAVLQLPEHYRSVVVLRHYENLKFREIAEVLEIPEGTVKSRMVEALGLLGEALRRSASPPGATPMAQAHRPWNQKEALLL